MAKKSKATQSYPENYTKQDSLDKAMVHFSALLGYPVQIDHNNCAKYLSEAVKYELWLMTCSTCGDADRSKIPVELRQGIGALYGANMGRLKGM